MVKASHLRFDVWIVNLDVTIGSEIAKARPCVIVSPNETNRLLNTIIIVPLTSTVKKYPTRIDITFQSRKGQLALDHIKSIDKSRLGTKIGTLSPAYCAQLCDRLQELFEM